MSKATGLLVLGLALGAAASQPPLEGANVCEETSSRTENITVRYEKEYKYREEEYCWDISKGFKCTVIKTGTKTAYRTQPVRKDEVVRRCCEGFLEEDSVDGDSRRCVPDVGPPASQPLKETAGSEQGGLGVGGIVGLLLVAVALLCLVAGVLYYRRKYHNEKDPAYPSVTYASEEGGVVKGGWENNEFDNPMYGAAAAAGDSSADSSVRYSVPPSTSAAKVPPSDWSPPPKKEGKGWEEETVGYAVPGELDAAGHYEVASSADGYSSSFSTAPTVSPYDHMPPNDKLAH